jgi:hypothetical protein
VSNDRREIIVCILSLYGKLKNMVPSLREAFNASWSPDKYARFLSMLDETSGCHVGFRNCETPCFLPSNIVDNLAQAGRDLTLQLTSNAEYRTLSNATIPDRYYVPNEDPLPLFIQADFGLAEGNQPKLVEIQAFPSLYAYQPFLARTYREAFDLDPNLSCFLSGLTPDSYKEILGQAILNGHPSENVILLEIQPELQKTRCDFLLTERVYGVRAVCVSKVRKHGRELYYERDGKLVRIHRIYNRAIVDELERKPEVRPGFDFRAAVDVEWAGHPNCYFRISKFSIPFLKHPSVPRTWFLDELTEIPSDLENYVLKPLYSFAGLGVVVGPSQADLDNVPADRRHDYILQERVNFVPIINTPHGPTKAEIRVMYIWPPGEPEPVPVTTIIRMGRGKMMGVDHNKNMEWVGASAAFVIPQ